MLRGWSFNVGSGGGGASSAFTIIQPITGTSPTATGPNSTLTFTSSDSSLGIAGNSGTNTVDFTMGIVPVAKGGFGQSMTMATNSSTGSITVAAGLIKLTGAFGVVVVGITAPSTSNFTYIYNDSAANVTIAHQNTGASAADRIILPGSASYLLPPQMGAWFFYDTAVSRWKGPEVKVAASSPLVYTQGTLSIPAATASNDGYMTSTQVSSLAVKSSILSPATQGNVTFVNSSTSLDNTDEFSWNTAKKQLGVQVAKADSEAAIHVKSTVTQTASEVSTVGITPTVFTLPSDISVYSVTSATPNLQTPNQTVAPAGFINGGSGGIQATGNTYAYLVVPSAGGTFCAGAYAVAIGSDPNDGVFYDIDIGAWATGTSVQTVDNYRIYRNVSGGGYVESQDIGNVTSFIDNGTGWVADTYPPSPVFPDFVAAGQTYNYEAPTFKSTPASTRCYSQSPITTSYTDTLNDGSTFLLTHAFTGLSDTAKVIKDSTNSYESAAGFTEDTTTFASSDVTKLPNTYGVLSNGSNSVDFTCFNVQTVNGVQLYSPTGVSPSAWTDPNDGAYYYFPLTATGIGTKVKWKNNVNNTGTFSLTGSALWDGGTTAWSDGSTVTPNSYLPPAVIAQAAMTSSGGPQFVVKAATSESFARQEWQTGSGTILGYIEAIGSGMTIGTVSSVVFVAIASSNVSNNSLFKNSADGKLSFKDNGGTVHALY